MQLFIDQLLEGITHSIDHVILPGLSSPYLRAQAAAISSSLRNLATRLAVIDEILLHQNHSLREIFQGIENLLSSSHELSTDDPSIRLRRKIEAQLARKYGTKRPLADENYDLKSLLEEAIEGLWEMEDRFTIPGLKDLHGRIRHFLKQEVETELGLLKPPDMAQISKG